MVVMTANSAIERTRKVVQGKSMAYRETSKRTKVWSEQANRKKAANRLKNTEPRPLDDDIDPYIKITVERRDTGETAVFECHEGTQINNYSVYCNGKHLGIQGITKIMENIRKALPAFRRMD